MKTSAGTICGTRAYYAADALEQQARADDKQGITTTAALLQRELDSFEHGGEKNFWQRARA